MVTEGRTKAPDGLAIIEDFVNTLDREGGVEQLVRPESLATWLEKWQLVNEPPRLTDRELERAKAFREDLRALLLANAGEPVAPAVVTSLNEIGARATLAVSFGLDGIAQLEPAASGIDAPLARLLAIVYTAMADGSWVRLKACRSQTCRWAFYDASKNRSGAWCTMAVCGNRNKVRAYQQRVKAGGR